MGAAAPDRLRLLLDAVLAAVDEPADGAEVAQRAHFSRFHFDRAVAAGAGEPPATLRRRVLLERAAWQLLCGMSVTEAGIEAGYGSTEAFSRAFARAHGVAPSGFAAGRGDFRLAAPNGIHFHPPAGLALRGGGARQGPTGLVDRLLEHDRWLTERLIERAAGLSDEQLDREVRPGHVVLGFDGPEPTARAMLDRLVWTKEVWTAAIGGSVLPEAGARSVDGLRARFAASGAAFVALARRIDERGEWDDVFVDALCDPPQSFTFGGAVAHVLTFCAHRREVLAGALAELDGAPREPGCPIEWERAQAAPGPRRASELRGPGRRSRPRPN